MKDECQCGDGGNHACQCSEENGKKGTCCSADQKDHACKCGHDN